MFLLTEPAGARGGVEDILDPLARSEAEEAAEQDNSQRPVSDEQKIASAIGAACWRRNGVFLDSDRRVAAKFWLVFDRPRLVCDLLPKDLEKEQHAWRAEVARANGFRYVAIIDGKPLDVSALRRAAGKE